MFLSVLFLCAKQGRMIAFGHEKYLDVKSIHESMAKFLDNAIMWLARKKCNIVIGSQVNISFPKFSKCQKFFEPKDLGLFRDVNVYVFMPGIKPTYEDVRALLHYVKNGGSLLIGGQAWSSLEPNLKYDANRYVHYTNLF
jgi:hypothetical protein